MVMLLSVSVYLSVHRNTSLSLLSVSVYLSVQRNTSLSLWGFVFSITLKCLSVVGGSSFHFIFFFNLLLRNIA